MLQLASCQPTDAAEAPAPAPATSHTGNSTSDEAGLELCIALLQGAGSSCTTESDTIALQYPRYSEALPTPDQESAALEALKSTGQPSQECCNNLVPFAEERCPCQKSFQDVLPLGGFSPAVFEGSTAILAKACGYDFEACSSSG
ncbi:hypothetical protein N2152v2_002793 [Parachlorella kessleri]